MFSEIRPQNEGLPRIYIKAMGNRLVELPSFLKNSCGLKLRTPELAEIIFLAGEAAAFDDMREYPQYNWDNNMVIAIDLEKDTFFINYPEDEDDVDDRLCQGIWCQYEEYHFATTSHGKKISEIMDDLVLDFMNIQVFLGAGEGFKQLKRGVWGLNIDTEKDF